MKVKFKGPTLELLILILIVLFLAADLSYSVINYIYLSTEIETKEVIANG